MTAVFFFFIHDELWGFSEQVSNNSHRFRCCFLFFPSFTSGAAQEIHRQSNVGIGNDSSFTGVRTLFAHSLISPRDLRESAYQAWHLGIETSSLKRRDRTQRVFLFSVHGKDFSFVPRFCSKPPFVLPWRKSGQCPLFITSFFFSC